MAKIENAGEIKARYIVGIDLGTTNSAMAYFDMAQKNGKVTDFPVLQVASPDEIAHFPVLPSSYYSIAQGEFVKNKLKLPWAQNELPFIVGMYARDRGAEVPGRIVVSAKSWLSHSGVDRTANLLPWHASADVQKISPIDATAQYLTHMKQAWDHDHPEDPLDKQDVVITVPASFDEVARELTITAAAQAGLQKIILLEEPQAAFYAWIDKHTDGWEAKVNPEERILICDIGGGTTDFTLIEVMSRQGKVEFQRIAVGEHLILGGDNFDLAIAYYIEKKQNKKFSPSQFSALVRSCQKVKERLLGQNQPDSVTVTIAGSGSSLIGGSLQIELTRTELEKVVLDGFFPYVSVNERPVVRQSGFQEFGLPYAPDPAITKYLASFLSTHGKHATSEQKSSIRPDKVLFNGGVFESQIIKDRLIEILKSWFGDDPSWKLEVLDNVRLDLAVARGAAYFGLVRQGKGIRIGAPLARSYYIGIDRGSNRHEALCIAPAGLEEGKSIDIENVSFELLIRQPVEFSLYVSSTRTTDKVGDFIEIDPLYMTALPPIRTVLRSGKKMEADLVQVQLHSRCTEIGTLDLWCSEIGGNRDWRLQFDIRSTTQTDLQAHKGVLESQGIIDNDAIEACRQVLHGTFGPGATTDPFAVGNVIKKMEDAIGVEKNSWPPSVLRALWETLLEYETVRTRNPQYESKWLNLLGFCLRPGYGYAVDDWRVKQTWLIYQKGVFHSRNQACTTEWWILWRRIAGGLTSGQQKTLGQPLYAAIKSYFDTSKRNKNKSAIKFGYHEFAEIWRLMASLEYIDVNVKIEIGNFASKNLINKEDPLAEAAIWALGRLGSRIPFYGPVNELVPQEIAQEWCDALIEKARLGSTLFISLMQICRLTNDRYRDLDDTTRTRVLDFLKKKNAPHHIISLVEIGGSLDSEEKSMVFGEKLPSGLRVRG